MGDGARGIENEHAVIQFIADLGGFRKALDESSQVFRQSLVANPDLGQSLDQIESRAGRVQCREHHCGGSLVGAQQNHQHVNEKTFVVRPAADQVSHQGENECAAIRRGGGRGSEHVKVRFWRQLADIHGNVSADAGCGPISLIVTASLPRKYISKDIIAKVGSALFCNHCKNKMSLSCCYLAAVPLLSTTSCHTRASWHSVGTSVNLYAQFRC